jgi:hypothetical protein
MCRKTIAKFLCSAILPLGLALAWSGCHEPGPMEKAGERTDEIVDNIKDGDSPFHKKGPLEKAGEAVDEAVDDVTDSD